MEQPDYLTYKKRKQQTKFDTTTPRKAPKIKFIFRFFVVTFILTFIIIFYITQKYSAKIDVEYSSKANFNDMAQSEENLDDIKKDNEKLTIDRRLIALYNDEIGLSKAKAVNQTNDGAIDVEQFKKIQEGQEEIYKEPADAKKTEKKVEKIAPQVEESNFDEITNEPVKKVTYTKILIGKYKNLTDAKMVQDQIRNSSDFENLTPFIRKIDDFYTIQIGSYMNAQVAKNIADKFKRANYNVWIVQ